MSQLEHFYLVGGTALALQLGHRESIDLDMFTTEAFDKTELLDTLNSVFDDLRIESEGASMLITNINAIKVDFVKRSYPILFPTVLTEGVRMLDIKDIAPMKLKAVTQRGSKKDFFDIYFLLELISMVEHSLWLPLIKQRLEILRRLLSPDGSIWISIDDNECHYLKVVCDEVFGRRNFVANVIWQKRTSPDFRATLGAGHDHILVFAREFEKFSQTINNIPKTTDQISKFKNPDNDKRGPWVSSDYSAQGYRPNQMYKIISSSGKEHYPPKG
jgi:hypothetical protein